MAYFMAQNPWNKTMFLCAPGLRVLTASESSAKKEKNNNNHITIKYHIQEEVDKDVNNVNLFLVNLAVAAAAPVSCALQTEAEESENAEYRELNDCPECEAVSAGPLWKSLCIDRNKTQKAMSRGEKMTAVELNTGQMLRRKELMLTGCCFYTTQVFPAERTKHWQTPAEPSHWLMPKKDNTYYFTMAMIK